MCVTDANAIRRMPFEGHGKILCIAFRPDGRHLVGGQDSGYIRQWNVDCGEEFCPSWMKSSGDVYAVATSMDGRWIVSGDKENKAIIWNAVTHQKAIQLSDHVGPVYAIDVSNDSTRIASGSGDYTVQVFDIVSGTRVIPPLCHTDCVVAVKFSPDGSQIATATSHQQGFVYIFDSRSGDKRHEISIPALPSPPLTPLAWSSDGQRLFVGSPDKIISFDTSTFYRSEWQHPHINKPAIVAHGRFIGVCCEGECILFWDYTSRKQIGSVG